MGYDIHCCTDSEGLANAKQEWWKSRDPVAALAKGSADKSSTSLLLRGLVKHGPWKDYVNALHFVSHNGVTCVVTLQELTYRYHVVLD